jgi:predicted nucleic acid-binding protein
VTVLDTSGLVDFLLGTGAARPVEQLLADEGELAAPDVIVFETLAVLRRAVLRRALSQPRAAAAVEDLGDVPLALVPALAVRQSAWDLRANLTAADALFAATAQALDEPLATGDRALAAAARRHARIVVIDLR